MKVGQSRAGAPKELKDIGDVGQSKSRQARTDRFTSDPATQVPGATPYICVGGPVVVGRGNRRMVPMPQLPGFLEQPCRVGRIRRGDKRERSSERVYHLLV